MSASASAVSGGSTARAEAHVSPPAHRSNEWLGMMLFIVSEAIIFGSLFAQYFYSRFQGPTWPPEGFDRVPAAPLALILTAILAASGFTAHWAQTAQRRGDRDTTTAWLAVTLALGVVFLAGQAFEYANLLTGYDPFTGKAHPPFGLNSGIYGSVFYTLTGLHGLHVTGGLVALGVVLARSLMGHFTPRNHFGLEGTILYWHFVDVVWFFLYVVLYLF